MHPRYFLAAGLALFAMASRSHAVIEAFDLNYVFSGTPPVGSAPWASVTLQDGLAANTVRLTFTANDLAGSEFASNWYLNTNPAIDATQFTFNIVSNPTGLSLASINTGENAFKADGDGYYDLLFQFPTSNWSNQLTNGKTVVIDVSRAAGLTVNDFLYQSAPGGGAGTYYSAAHVQGIGSNSGWIGTQTPETLPIPEPSTYAIWLGLMAFGVAIRYKSRFQRPTRRRIS